MKTKKVFWVDIPDSNLLDQNGTIFENVATFSTRKEAIEFCKKAFGADSDGNLNLITEGEV